MSLTFIQTVKGIVSTDQLGLILPHEHLFTDLRGPWATDYALADLGAVEHTMVPYMEAALRAGATAIVECSTVGVGRNIPVLRCLAEAAPIHIIAPTGVYRDAYVPPRLRNMGPEDLAKEWIRELTLGMEGTEIRAGFIKVAVSDNGPTALEVRNLKAAATASRQTGASVMCHIPEGVIAQRVVEVLGLVGLDLSRFVWAHANLEPDPALHLEAARRGVYVEFDAVGAVWQSQEAMVDYTVSLIEAGQADRILLSHDAGWYDPSQADGKPLDGGVRGYTALVLEFIPMLRARGVTDELIHLMTVVNPARAISMSCASQRA